MKVIRYVSVLLMLFFPVMVKAQDLKSLFVAMPDSVCPLLTAVNRADFGDFLDSGMKAVVKNRFDKPSEMKTMTKDYIKLNLTSANVWEMKLLPVNDSTMVICVVKTFCLPAQDSSIEFYDTNWQKQKNSQFIEMADESAFFRADLNTEQQDSLAALKQSVGLTLVSIRLSEADCSLAMRCTSAEYMGKDEKKDFLRFVGPDVTYDWIDGRFVMNKTSTPLDVAAVKEEVLKR